MLKLPLPKDANNVYYLANADTAGNIAVPMEQYVLSAGLYVPVSAANPLPTSPPAAATVLSIASAAITAAVTSSDLVVGSYKELAIDVNVSVISGTTPSYTLTINRKGADGVYYPIYTGTALTAVGKISISLGKGASTNIAFGSTIQVVETVAGTTPSITRSVSIVGK